MSLRDLLIKKLGKSEVALVPSSFDVIGNRDKAVAIIEIPEELRKKKKIIAEALMEQHPNVKTVLEKASPRKGVYRTRTLKIIAGSRKTEVMHIENGCRFFVDPRKAYFSQREATERARVASEIHEGDAIMVFFAGVGALPILMAKKARLARCVGIEINPDAVESFRKNMILNKTANIEAVLGDVREKHMAYKDSFDRVLMPLPETSEEFLAEALSVLKRGGIASVYFFAAETELKEREKDIAGKLNGTVFKTVRVLPYGPRIWKYRTDVVVKK
ncbi:MAG: class I SAM-dependent methyltransferase family protein [Candidatus Aenigmarchaeota archaeon]|nr:class I SAM-dependent methyltransferase family protein [Candidatus Aenigmarchaeota archaeon]